MYRLALEILPDFDKARNNLGVALRRRGHIAEAIEQYKLAIETDPDCGDPQLAQQLGVVPEEEAGELFEGRVRESWQPPAEAPRTDIERPEITFKDVGGMDELKERLPYLDN